MAQRTSCPLGHFFWMLDKDMIRYVSNRAVLWPVDNWQICAIMSAHEGRVYLPGKGFFSCTCGINDVLKNKVV